MDLIEGLGEIIGNVDSSPICKANAVRLAYTVDAWEVAGAIRFAETILTHLRSDELVDCQQLIHEIDAFYSSMNMAAQAGDSDRQNDGLDIFRDFINTLDFSGFGDKKE